MISNFSLDHIGIAVKSIAESEGFYLALGLVDGGIEEVTSEKVRVKMLELKNQSRIELLEATSDASPIAKFLEKRGPGIHHICLRVQDLRQLLKQLKSKGVKLIHEEPFMGAHNCLVAFVHPHSTGGVLLELSELQPNAGSHGA